MNTRGICIDILDHIESRETHSEQLVDDALSMHALRNVDARLVTEIVYGTLRWRGRLDWMIQKLVSGPFDKLECTVKNALRVGLYQIEFLNRVPHNAAVNETVDAVKQRTHKGAAGLVNGVLRNSLRNPLTLPPLDIKDDETWARGVSVHHSMPVWIIQDWKTFWGRERTIALCEASVRTPRFFARVNRLRITREELAAHVWPAGTEARWYGLNTDFFEVDRLSDPAIQDLLTRGLISIQDPSAGFPCLLLDPKPGETVADVCAAPGGKTGYLAELAEDSAQILAMDAAPDKMALLEENLRRLGLKSVTHQTVDARSATGRFNKVLADVPCSGLGVLSKRSDLRWRKTPRSIEQLAVLQKQILNHCSRLVSENGVLVYSTCTLQPQENEQIVADFLKTHPEFALDDAARFLPEAIVTHGMARTFPDIDQIDGSFCARLVRS